MEAERAALDEGIEWFLDHLKVERGASPHTILAYHNDLDQAASFFTKLGVHSRLQAVAVLSDVPAGDGRVRC